MAAGISPKICGETIINVTKPDTERTAIPKYVAKRGGQGCFITISSQFRKIGMKQIILNLVQK
jgi:hypothetical protein